MRNTCDKLTYFGTGLSCVYVLRMYTFANLSSFFYVGGKIIPYFVQITQNKALFWNARIENINKTQTRTQTHFVTFVFVHVYMVYVLFVGGRIRPYFGQIRPYFIAYVKETQTET